MVRDTVGVALAGVLAGLATMLFVAAIAVQPFLVAVAIPFAAGAYLVWQASIGEYGRASPAGARRARARAANERTASDGPGHATAGERRRRRERRQEYERARTEGRRRASGGDRGRGTDTLARKEAARVLGVDVDADAATVRRAYRERVKEVHPDTEGGDAETFQKVNDAYERLDD